MDKLRVGVVGTGYLGKFHAEKYAAMEDVDLVGVVDSDGGRAEAVARRLETRAYVDYRDLLDQVDAISIVVPTPLHHRVSLDFIRRGVDVMIEKPMTRTMQEADDVIEASEASGVIVQVGHLERYNPAVVALQGIVKEPMFIESHRLSLYKERCADVSVVLDLMIHDIDIIQNFVRSEITTIHAAGISAVSNHVDIANARLEFANGCVANVTASRISAKNQRKIRMFQRDAYISVDFATREISVVKQEKDPECRQGPIPGMSMQLMSFTEGDALESELRAFVHAVRTREVPEVSAQVGRDALKTALIIMDQIQSKMKRYIG